MTLHTSGISPVVTASPATISSGTFTGDGSGTITVNIGFTPQFVILIDMAATTGSSRYMWIQGMAATDSLLDNGTTDIAIDANSAVVTNGALNATTQVGVYAPGTSEANAGTLINTSLSVYYIDESKAQLVFGINVSTHVYVWVAIG